MLWTPPWRHLRSYSLPEPTGHLRYTTLDPPLVSTRTSGRRTDWPSQMLSKILGTFVSASAACLPCSGSSSAPAPSFLLPSSHAFAPPRMVHIKVLSLSGPTWPGLTHDCKRHFEQKPLCSFRTRPALETISQLSVAVTKDLRELTGSIFWLLVLEA